jgi:hypothetical protein
MPLQEEVTARVKEALDRLSDLREAYKDVLVVLDYVTLADIANVQVDSDVGDNAGDLLDEEQLAAVLWRLGKHVGGDETSHSVLPALIQFALDEKERRETT